jgi:hypothetical protein
MPTGAYIPVPFIAAVVKYAVMPTGAYIPVPFIVAVL